MAPYNTDDVQTNVKNHDDVIKDLINRVKELENRKVPYIWTRADDVDVSGYGKGGQVVKRISFYASASGYTKAHVLFLPNLGVGGSGADKYYFFYKVNTNEQSWYINRDTGGDKFEVAAPPPTMYVDANVISGSVYIEWYIKIDYLEDLIKGKVSVIIFFV